MVRVGFIDDLRNNGAIQKEVLGFQLGELDSPVKFGAKAVKRTKRMVVLPFDGLVVCDDLHIGKGRRNVGYLDEIPVLVAKQGADGSNEKEDDGTVFLVDDAAVYGSQGR